MATRMLAVVAVALAARTAAATDYPALMEELKELQADPLVTAYVAKDLRASHRLESLYSALMDGLDGVRSLRQRAKEQRGQQSAGMVLLLAGDPVLNAAGTSMLSGPSPEELEARAAQLASAARDTLVELVASYREVREAAVRAAASRRRPDR